MKPDPAWKRALGWTAAGVALLLVFAAWHRPEITVDLANLIRSCF